MYYLKGLGFGSILGLLTAFLLVVGNLLSVGDSIILIGFLVGGLSLGVIGYRFKARYQIGVYEMLAFNSTQKNAICFPFGIATISAITNASIQFYDGADLMVIYLIPIGILGNGLSFATAIAIGMWCKRANV